MPGGVDMHCHIAGPKVNVARKMRPEEKRKAEVLHRTANTHSGTLGSVPSTFASPVPNQERRMSSSAMVRPGWTSSVVCRPSLMPVAPLGTKVI